MKTVLLKTLRRSKRWAKFPYKKRNRKIRIFRWVRRALLWILLPLSTLDAAMALGLALTVWRDSGMSPLPLLAGLVVTTIVPVLWLVDVYRTRPARQFWRALRWIVFSVLAVAGAIFGYGWYVNMDAP
jgi:hypothetical protein